MSLFGRKDEDEYDEEFEVEDEKRTRKIRDLNPRNRKKRKEPPKPWGKKERYITLSILLASVITASILGISARDFKLPGLPRFSFRTNFNLRNLFKEETITIGKGTTEQKQRSDKVISGFEEKTRNLSGTYALYVIDLTNSYSFGIEEERVMQAASLIKLPVMLFVQGKENDSVITAMGKRSDNSEFIRLRGKYGDPLLQDYIASLGMEKTSIEENETTPKEIGELFKKIYEDNNQEIMDALTDTIYEEWLSKGVPEEVKVSHKYGREVHVVNDAGIVTAKKPYIVVIMTEGVVEKEADKIFPELSKLVYDGFTQ